MMEASEGRTVYANCMRNLTANQPAAFYTTDGCGEFHSDDGERGLLCSACGCHRSFHRKVVEGHPFGCVVAGSKKRRKRTRFTGQQRIRMAALAEKLGWRMPVDAEEDDEVQRFCSEVGISRRVFRTWLHNHKSAEAPAAAASKAVTLPSASAKQGFGVTHL